MGATHEAPEGSGRTDQDSAGAVQFLFSFAKFQSSKGAVNRARALHVRRIRAKSKAGGETPNRTKKAP